MRVAAFALVATLLLPGAALIVRSAPSSCCCAGATCPMKRSARPCGAASCGLRSAEPSASVVPPITDFRVAFLPQGELVPAPATVRPFAPQRADFASADARAPEPPPPRLA
jgi:hypothetical protein